MARPVSSPTECRNCGAQVVKCVTKSGSTYIANIDVWEGDMGGFKTLYPSHNCDENEVAYYQARIERELAEGKIVQGQHVIALRGRKVPVGTAGVVFWIKHVEDYDGKILSTRIGIKDEHGNAHFVDAKHCIATNQLERA